jgi:hypothetical protein
MCIWSVSEDVWQSVNDKKKTVASSPGYRHPGCLADLSFADR